VGLRIALFGQAAFGGDCLDRLRGQGHEIVGVFVPPDGERRDPLGAHAEELGLHVIRRRYFRRRDATAIPEAVTTYRSLGAELNVLAFVSVFLPREILDTPKHRSLCFHPSLLPRYRGGAAVNWQIILGERESGVTVFIPDEGVDTGPIVVQRGGVEIAPEDTAGTLYFSKLYPLGLEAILEAVRAIETGSARPVPQEESASSFQGLVDDRVARVDLKRPAAEIDRLVRGCDPQPGAFVRIRGDRVRLYDTRLEAPRDAEPESLASIDEEGFRIALRGGSLRVARVRADGGKENAREFASRLGLRPGERIESG
jgi:methionyl-tRNA formyltransferase